LISDTASGSKTTPRLLFVRYALLTALAIHFSAISFVSMRELSWLVANGLTIVPTSWRSPAQNIEDFSVAALAENLEPGNNCHQTIATYLNLAGIQGAYGFFAPNVSDSYRLVFEFQFPDGHVEQDLPHVSSEESAVRLAGVLDEIARTRIGVLREALVKLLAEETWNNYPDAIALRATFRSTSVGPAGQSNADASEQIIHTYEFALTQKKP
jgi:hypothetical protein